jgi:hypothetical protein
LEGLLERAGFKILKTIPGQASFVQYLCGVTGEVSPKADGN